MVKDTNLYCKQILQNDDIYCGETNIETNKEPPFKDFRLDDPVSLNFVVVVFLIFVRLDDQA